MLFLFCLPFRLLIRAMPLLLVAMYPIWMATSCATLGSVNKGKLVQTKCMFLVLTLWGVSWLTVFFCHHLGIAWPWWLSPGAPFLLLPSALPVAALLWLAFQLGMFPGLMVKVAGKGCLLLGMPVKMPSGRPLPKIWLWRAFLSLARVFDATAAHGLLQCIVWYLLCSIASSRLHLQPVNTGIDTPPQLVNRPALEDDEDALLAHLSTANTPRFVPDVHRGKVTSVYDGDTLTVAARHGGHGKPYRFALRLLGIDAPEIRGVSDREKQAALAARDVLRAAILGEIVTLDVSAGFDKYGRLLAVVRHDRYGDVSRMLLEHGHALPYDGGTRAGWDV